jgi:hypothetical protein
MWPFSQDHQWPFSQDHEVAFLTNS